MPPPRASADIDNTGQIPTWFEGHPPAEPLAEYKAEWSLPSQKRTFALIVEDMEKDYDFYIDFILPNAVSLLKTFRDIGQPVVWTNWNRLQVLLHSPHSLSGLLTYSLPDLPGQPVVWTNCNRLQVLLCLQDLLTF